jgi:glutamyl-tRNA synthetase
VSDPTPRLRIAPSPTGYFHVGGARTALFNWLHARQHGGRFVLRIEDTDAERNDAESVAGIQRALAWLGLDWDEGPFFQSERGELYAAATEKLEAAGRAYWCDCTRDDVEARKPKGAPPGYDGFCRDRGLGRGPGRALRFRTPDEGATTVVDLIRGEPTFENATIDDFVIVRSNGSPIFILANVVDDIDMRINVVVRGEEHLPNTPKGILLWEALDGGPLPVFAHVPVLVNEKRQKLSKRRDKVALEDYRDQGFLPEAMRNYLATLGWGAPDGVEIRPFEEIQELFRLGDVVPSPAFFDEKKLRNFNGVYIRELGGDEFVTRVQPWLAHGPWPEEAFNETAFSRLAPLVQERVETLADVPGMVDFVFLPEPEVDERSWEKAMKEPAAALLDDAIVAYGACDWEADELKSSLERIGERHGLKLGKAQAPVRVAVTGRTVGPPLFESLEVLGREETLRRLRAARDRL